MLRKWFITHVKVQWNHFRPKASTLEDEQVMSEYFPGLLAGEKDRDDL